MSLDGFSPGDKEAFAAFSPALARRFFATTDALARRCNVHVEGLEHVPRGRGLLVANHSFGFDVLLPTAAIAHRLDRRVWMLGEHLWWTMPFIRRFVAAIGVVDGTRENLDRLLAADELVLVLPGGLREAVKPRELRYQLLWGHRYGFVRAAMRNQAPLVPLACVGGDELFDLVGNPFRRGARWLGRDDLPIPLPSRVLPIPHLMPLRFVLGEPIVPPVLSPQQSSDVAVERRLRRELEGALHELIEQAMAQRLGIPL